MLPDDPANGAAPFSTLFCSSFGNPPYGCPSSPRNMDTTDSGNAISRVGSSTASRSSPLVTIISAMSPTTLDVGVTLTMSPNMSFTSAYACATSGHRSPKPRAARLLAQVGVLAARHAVHVNLRRAGPHVAFERRVAAAHRFEVTGNHADVLRVEPGCARIVPQRFDDRTEIRLRREAAHRIHRGVHRVATGIDAQPTR